MEPLRPPAVQPLQAEREVSAVQRHAVPGPRGRGADRQGRAGALRVVCCVDLMVLIVLVLSAQPASASAATAAVVRPGP